MTVCVRCGRVGSRGFVLLRGIGLRYGGDEQNICATTAACNRRAARSWREQQQRITTSGPGAGE